MAQVLRNYVEDPAPSEPVPDDPRLEEQDYGNIVVFEHINLEVPDLEEARLFYSEVLGLTLDPSRLGAQRGGAHVMWFNIGRQQLHIAKGPMAQILPPGATIGLVLPHADLIPAQAAGLHGELGDLTVTLLGPGTLRIASPHGVVFQVHKTLKGFAAEAGIAYVHLPCFAGTSSMIGRFYSQTLGAPVKLRGHTSDSTAIVPSCTIDPEPATGVDGLSLSDHVVPPAVVPKHPGVMSPSGPRMHPPPLQPNPAAPIVDVSTRVRAVVRMGPGTELVFYEEPALGRWSTQGALSLYSGWHMCFYVSQYSPCYLRLRGLLFNSHPYRDKVHNFSDALKNHQFRFQDIVLLPDSLRPPLMLESGPEVDPTATPRTATSDAGSAANAATGQNAEAALVPKAQLGVEPIWSLVVTHSDEVSDRGVPVRVGSLLYRISHEVRSLAHPNLMRPLFNRGIGFK